MKGEVKIIELHEDIFRKNNEDSQRLRELLKKNGTLLINVMSSPGAGKTTLLRSIINSLKNKYKIAVIEADIDGNIDALRIDSEGVDVVQTHTGGCCHLSADMTMQGLMELPNKLDYDIIFLENVGNLVCPAEFDTGSTINMMLLSVPEGHDKPLKYPLMFKVSNLIVVTKCDTLPIFKFDKETFENYVKDKNNVNNIFYVSAKTGDGMKSLNERIIKLLEEQKR